jgi:hypothetical protein
MSSLLRHVALVPDDNIGNALSPSKVTRVAAALQKQVSRDFNPIWEVNATVSAFTSLEDVPLGYWSILVGKEGQNGGGVHLDSNNQPYALVDFTRDWMVTASHECLEMLADPFGNRLVAGDSPDPDRPGRVEFLLEVCDPCEVPSLGYTVNGIRVSDFYMPRYFEPPQPARGAGARYDFMGHISEPRQVLQGGYLSWREPDANWFQELFFGKRQFRKLGKFDSSFGSLRAWVDNTTLDMRRKVLTGPTTFPKQVLVSFAGKQDSDNDLAGDASRERAANLRQDIEAMRKAVEKVAPGRKK